MSVRKRTGGFTLVELLIAMSLFVVLSTALIALLTQAFDFLSSGTSGSEVVDKATDFVGPFREDLKNVVVERGLEKGPPRIRFFVDFIPMDSDADGTIDYHAQCLRFVRSTHEELADPVLRKAGTKAGAKAFVDGKQDREQAEAGELKAPGGMMEVLYVAIPDDPKDPGVQTLYRATRAPVGGAGSLLDPGAVKTPDDVRRIGQPFLTGVLHFGVELESPATGSSPGAGLSTWDSTRGILKPGSGPGEFAFARGKESLEDPRDDISPRSLVVTFVFERTGKENEEAILDSVVSEAGRTLQVTDTVFANTSEEQYVKVGTEWVSWASRSRYEFTGVSRGERWTVPVRHQEGETVRTGYTVRRTIPIPAYREDFNQERR